MASQRQRSAKFQSTGNTGSGGLEKNGLENRVTARPITRRRFLIGAGITAATAAVVGGSVVALEQRRNTSSIGTLSVPTSSVFTLDDCTQIDPSEAFEQVGNFTLPFGSLIWVNDTNVAGCLIPTESASPLVQGALLNLSNGNHTVVLKTAQSAQEGFEVYDLRATESGVVWIEENIFDGQWRLYCAPLSSGFSLGSARLVDEGTNATDIPSLAAVGSSAFWQVAPAVTTKEKSSRTGKTQIKRAAFSTGDAEVIHESNGQPACEIYASDKGIAAAPHHPDSSRYYQIVCFDEQGTRTGDALTLPAGMKPTEVGWGPSGMSFCFESIYNFGDGIANLGTYVPARTSSDYNQVPWFRFGRTPLAAPAWCTDSWLAVKSTQSVCAVNVAEKTYCAFDVPSGAASWGDYLVSSGQHGTIVAAAQVSPSTSDTSQRTCKVRVWKPV